MSGRSRWDTARWDRDMWDVSYLGKFDEVLAAMEKVNVGEYLFTPGHVMPGMDNFKSRARDIIKSLEK
jgi:hypothetical protein